MTRQPQVSRSGRALDPNGRSDGNFSSVLEQILQLRPLEGRMTVTEKASFIAKFLGYARDVDALGESVATLSRGSRTGDEPGTRLAEACREVAVLLGQATTEQSVLRAAVRRCLAASSPDINTREPDKDAIALPARMEAAERSQRACRELLSLL